jgi:hypothetical protein
MGDKVKTHMSVTNQCMGPASGSVIARNWHRCTLILSTVGPTPILVFGKKETQDSSLYNRTEEELNVMG